MQMSQTAVLERGAQISGVLETEPFEVGWAREARWFVRRLDDDGGPMQLATQVSPDGLVWCDHEAGALRAADGDLLTLPVREFGSWLRLRAALADQDATAEVIIYLVLKS